MKIPDLMIRLCAWFPNSFRNDQYRRILQEDYHNALRRYEGEPLRSAWNALKNDWQNGWPPKPADILKYIEHKPDGSGGPSNLDRMVYMERRAPEMMRDWFREHPDVVAAAKREFWFFIPLESELRKQAQFAAQREFNRRHGSQKPPLRLEITDDELKRMRRVWGRKPADEAEAPPEGWKRLKTQNQVRAA